MAISIGLAAALTMMPTVTVLADDDREHDGSDSNQSQESNSESTQESSEESSSIDSAEKAVSEASESIDAAESFCEAPEDTSAAPSADAGSADAAAPSAEDSGAADAAAPSADAGTADAAASSADVGTADAAAPSADAGAADAAAPAADATAPAADATAPAADAAAFSVDVFNSLEASQNAMDSIGGDLATLDQLNKAVEAANENVEQALGTDNDGNIDNSVVSFPVSNAGTKVDTAADSVETASDSVDDTSNEVAESSSKTAEAAGATYESEAAAQAAKNQALQDLAGVDAKVAESQQAVDTAQQAVDEAGKALEVAQGAVDTAADALEKAQAAEKAAKDKLDQLKQEWDFEIVDGKIVFGTKPADENRARAAIVSVSQALDQAKAETGEAVENLVEANEAEKAAAEALKAAAENKAKIAGDAYNDYVESFGENGENRVKTLENMLQQIKDQRNLMRGKQEPGATGAYTNYGSTYTDNRNMTALIAQYMLAQDPDVDIDSIKITRDADGNAIKADNKGVKVEYVKDGVAHTEYFNYKAIYRDGKELKDDEIKRRGFAEVDHVLITKVETGADNKNIESPFISEAAINIGFDTYQSLRNAKAAAEAEAKKAANLEDAQARLADAEEEAKDLGFLTSPEYKDRVDTVLKAINVCQADVQSEFEKGKNNLEKNRELARSLVEYTLLQRMYNGEIDGYRFDTLSNGKMSWVNHDTTGGVGGQGHGQGVESNYGIVYLTKDGVETPEYFDYIVYYDDGETCESGSQNNIGNYTKSGRKIDHILVVKKGASQEKGGKLCFDLKGEALITFANVQSDQTKVQNVEKAKKAVNLAGLAAIEEAKQKVIEAVKALNNIRVTGAESAQKFNELKAELEEAQKNYDNTVEAFTEAKAKLGETMEARNALEKTINDGFNKVTPAPAAVTGAEQTTGSTTAASTGSTTAAPTGGTTAASTGGTTAAPTGDAAASDDGGSTGGTSDASSGGGSDTTATDTAGGASVDITASTPGAPAEAIGGAGVLGETAAAEAAGLGGGAAVADAGAGSVAGNSAASAGMEAGVIPGDDLLEDGVLGERMAPLVEAVENGTFSRGMLFTEDGLKINIWWWLVILAMGAKGVQMYVKSRKKAAAEEEDKEI